MRFDDEINPKYRRSIEAALQTILAEGNDFHRGMIRAIIESEMLVYVRPVSKIRASGVTGLNNWFATGFRIQTERLNLREALGEVFITIAVETIDTGGQRGCEGTFVHEGRHALDFAQTISSFSDSDMHRLNVFDPTVYELEWEAHKTSGDYMLQINRDEYLQEGLDLMILERGADGGIFVSDEGIKRRLRESYGLEENGNRGKSVSEMFGLRQR
jgi:hypothetical protein